MSIENEAYQALEDIVGPENITREPVVLDSYCYVWGNELLTGGDKFSARPLAVVMPETSEEVQAIVKACNRFSIRCRPFASGFETAAVTAPEPMLAIDMRRMNRIIRIDKKNKIAVVEPYVSQTRLMIETMKLGLRPNIAGGGPSCSILASTAAHFGSGPANISADFGGRNLMGIEWIQPDGNMVRLGPVGDGDTYVNADGPGPSLRGVVRGYGGANGGIGIFTKCVVKLYPWYGPQERIATGCAPIYSMDVPDNFEDYCVRFSNREDLTNFMHLLYEETIAYAQERPGLMLLIMLTTESNDDVYAALMNMSPQLLLTASYSMLVTLDACSIRELEYKKRVFKKIVETCRGVLYPMDEHMKGVMFHGTMTAQGTVRGAFRSSGSFIVTPICEESIDSANAMPPRAQKEILNEAQASGNIMGGIPEAAWSVIYGSDGCNHVEMITQYDPADPDSVKTVAGIIEKSDEKEPEWGYGINMLENALSYKETALKGALPYTIDFVKWMKKIKRAFDPNNVAESAFYVAPEATRES